MGELAEAARARCRDLDAELAALGGRAEHPSRQQAEQVVAVVGIKNAQEAYFRGAYELIGGS